MYGDALVEKNQRGAERHVIAINRFILREMKMSCKQASRLASQALDRPLTRRERFAMWLHLSICDPCSQFVAQLRLLRTALQQQLRREEQDESVKLSDSARDTIREKLHQH